MVTEIKDTVSQLVGV